MPGDPEECRQHAANCKALAEHAATPEAREHFLRLAEQWERLAADLLGSQVFRQAMEQIEPDTLHPSRRNKG